VAQPAAAQGDQITGTCSVHLMPNPATGVPQPSPPMPFAAPILNGCVPTVLVGGKPVAVVGASGLCTPPHVGLHPSDPFMVPTAQMGTVAAGSTSVLAGGVPVARTGDQALLCAGLPGTVTGSAANVLVGG